MGTIILNKVILAPLLDQVLVLIFVDVVIDVILDFHLPVIRGEVKMRDPMRTRV